MKVEKTVFHLLLVVLFSCSPRAETNVTENGSLWVDQTSTYLPVTAEWTNRVEVADINQDGLIDILFANGGNYTEPGPPESSRVFLNQGPDKLFKEVTAELFDTTTFIARVIKVRDVDGDKIPDILIGTTYQTQSQLYKGLGDGVFKNVTSAQLPIVKASVGDLELGDVDDDGDLDIVLVDWGVGFIMNNAGGRTMLWLNDGRGNFTDATATQMPEILIQFSWDVEFLDFDNDFDLDIAISCKRCGTSRMYINDGDGNFSFKRLLPEYTNNYELESMDVNGDGFLDLVTVNDGAIVGRASSNRREHLFLNDSAKGFLDVTEEYWPPSENIGKDDNNIVFLDYDSDGDPDFLLSSLTGEDRLLVNDGTGRFKLSQPVLSGDPTPLTLSIVLGDINNDNKLDIIMGQGEGEKGIEERIFMGNSINPDTAPPIISHYKIFKNENATGLIIKARIHDNKSPNMPQDWTSIDLTIDEESAPIQMTWYGENLWYAEIPNDLAAEQAQLCATDYAGNKNCRTIQL